MHETDELTLVDLIADAQQIILPAPRTPRQVIDLTAAEPHTLRIPSATLSLVDGYADYGV